MTIYTRNGIPVADDNGNMYTRFNAAMFQMAMDTRGIDTKEVHEGTGIALPILNQLSSGNRQPSADELQALSEMLRYPIHFFYQEGQYIRPSDVENGWCCYRVEIPGLVVTKGDYEELPTQLPLF